MYSVPSAQALPHARLALSAGVQTMRARICSVISCDMFARVVQLKLRVARHCRFPLCPVPHALATHCFLRLTRARGVSSQREGNALFADFWYFSSVKSTIKEKFLYVSSRASARKPPRVAPGGLQLSFISVLFFRGISRGLQSQ